MNQALLVYNRVVLELKFLAHLVTSQALLAAFEHNKARLDLFAPLVVIVSISISNYTPPK